jgi:hypothetical protein
MANTRAQKTAQNLSTLTTAGDIAYASAAGTPARLGIGSSAQVLTVASGVPSWATAASGGMTLLSTTSQLQEQAQSSHLLTELTRIFMSLFMVLQMERQTEHFSGGQTTLQILVVIVIQTATQLFQHLLVEIFSLILLRLIINQAASNSQQIVINDYLQVQHISLLLKQVYLRKQAERIA